MSGRRALLRHRQLTHAYRMAADRIRHGRAEELLELAGVSTAALRELADRAGEEHYARDSPHSAAFYAGFVSALEATSARSRHH